MKIVIFSLLSIFCCNIYCQRIVSGQISDSENNKPIPGASVFITNTTVGITTDIKGNYRLRIPGEGSYTLVVSHVGYQSVVTDIKPESSSMVFNVAMKIKEFDDVVVSAGIRFRRNDINLFWRTILGINPSPKTIQATNPEVVYYYYNPETKILKVTCREPLQIINYQTGYQINYVLEKFIHDYNTGITDWSQKCVFTELEPDNPKQKKMWEKKRREVYSVSFTKFIKSLYNNTLKNDGFLLADFRLNADPSNPFSLSILKTDSILSTFSGNNGKTINLSNHRVLLICFGKSVTDVDLARLERSQYPSVQYAGVSNVSRPTVNQYRQGDYIDKIGLFRSLLQGKSIRIFPDGTFSNELEMASLNDESSSPLMGLIMKLPIEYMPEGSILVATTNFTAENVNDFDKIVLQFHNQLNEFPQEKIHLHTDRDRYISGEKIWFKAYVTDALTNQYPTPSQYVYVELISPVDTLMNRVMIRPTDNMFYGNLPLTQYIPTGNYTLRAYTRYMENLGDDFFFKKTISIDNLATTINQQRPTAHKGLLKDDFGVSFFPEGGNLPEGVRSKVAFKALNSNGYPETVSGMLMDANGVEITSVKTFHAGMGVFEYIPEAGKKFFLKCENAKGLKKQFELPQSNLYASSLAISQQNETFTVTNRQSANNSNKPNSPCYLLVHCRGTLLYFSEWDTENESVLFDGKELPVGIIQFVLFDEQMNPLSERLVFNKNYDDATIEFQTEKEFYGKREKVIATLSLSPFTSGRVGEGHLSVAITDDKDIAVDSSTTILSSLLLSSELKGYIENPAYYLKDTNESNTALDYLMLTHGWRRYNIPEVIKGNPEIPKIAYQISQEISGSIKSPVLSKPVAGCEVLILVDKSDYGITTSDENGRFRFQDFEYPDSTTYFIRALNQGENDRNEIILNEKSFPKPNHAIQSPHLSLREEVLREETKNEPKTNDFIKKAEQRSRYDEDMWVIHLSEVAVSAPRIKRKEEPHLQFWANASSHVTIQREEIEKRAYFNVADYLRLIPGINISRDHNDPIGRKSIIKFEGADSFISGTSPLFIVDGFPPANFNLSDLSYTDIESIDIFKGLSTTIFGMKGANGVISITTKKGEKYGNLKKNESNYIQYTPLGYQKPVEFYYPKYETLESKNLNIPDFRTTIFWKPDVVISDEKEATFEFYTSDFPTTYSVVIEGLTSDGRIIRQVEKISVK